MIRNRNIFLIIALLFTASSAMFAQNDWGASDEEKATQLQVKFNNISINGGGALFGEHCQACHGELGANSPVLPTAKALGTVEFNKNNSDGLIHYKIAQGNAANGMPGFQATLSDEEIWKVVTYIRSSWDEYEPPAEITAAASSEPQGAVFEGKLKEIIFEIDQIDSKLSAKLVGENNSGELVYASNIPLEFRVVGYFGDFAINKGAKTDENGEVEFTFPQDLPADTAGFINLYAAVPTSAGYGELKSDVREVEMGAELNWIPPLSKRSLWGPMANIPLWLLFSYLGITGLVWLGIFYVVFQLYRIWMLRER